MFTYIDLVILLFSVLTVGLVRAVTGRTRPPVFNVYQRPSRVYWFKVVFMYVILKLRQIKSIKEEKLIGDKYERLDKPQTLSKDEKAVDAVFFNGANANGDHLVIATARRKNKLVDGFVFLKINDSNLGVLEHPRLPHTELYQTEESEEYEAEGIKISVVEPMKKWHVTYEGKMKKMHDPSEFLDVKIDVEWTSSLPCFNVDTNMDPLSMAKSMGLEPWSREYFDTLKEIHQTHYEQYGDFNGSATINGKCYDINMNVLRDHSIAQKREWRNFHRYGLHFFSVENGDRITVGVISTPMSFSSLTMGFVYSAKDGKLNPVQSCDLLLHQHGENGDPPVDYAFSLTAGNRVYVVKVQVNDSPHFYISKDWEAKIFERLCAFNVNGLKGWGAAEWQYRNVNGKRVEDFVKL